MGEPLSPNTSASISAVEREWESRLISKNLELAESETRLLRTESALEAASSLTEKLSEELSTAKRDSRDIIEHLERTLQESKVANDEVTAALHDKTQIEERQSQHIAKLEKELARQKDKLEQALEFEKEHHKLLRRVAELEERVRETEVTANTEMVMRHQEHKQRLVVEEDNINLRRELSKSVHESRVFGYPWSVRLVLSPLPLHAKGAVRQGATRDSPAARDTHTLTTFIAGQSCLVLGGQSLAQSHGDPSNEADLVLELGQSGAASEWHMLMTEVWQPKGQSSLAGPALDFDADASGLSLAAADGVNAKPGPQAQFGVATCTLRKRLFVFGGRLPDGTLTNELWSLNTATRRWKVHAMDASTSERDVPPPAEGCAMCAIGGVIQEEDMLLLLGGSTVPLERAWRQGQPPPADRRAVLRRASGLHDPPENADLLDGGYIYHVATGMWRSLPAGVLDNTGYEKVPRPGRAFATLTVSPDRRLAYAFGGFDVRSGRPCSDLFALTLVDLPQRARPWRAPTHVAGTVPPSRGFHDALFAGKHLVIAGGIGVQGRLTDAYVLDCIDLTWERFHALDADHRVRSLGGGGGEMGVEIVDDDAASVASTAKDATSESALSAAQWMALEPPPLGRNLVLVPSGTLSGQETFRCVDLVTSERGMWSEAFVRDVYVPPDALVSSMSNANGVLMAAVHQPRTEDAKTLEVSWSIRTSHAVEGYKVFMGLIGSPNVREVYSTHGNASTGCRVSGLRPGAQYQVRVKAELGEAMGTLWSAIVSCATAWGGPSASGRSASAEPSEELQQFRTPGFGLPPRALSSLGGHRASAQRSQVLPALDAEAGSPMGLARAGSNMKKKRLSPMEKPLPPNWQRPSPIERPLDGKSGSALKRRP